MGRFVVQFLHFIWKSRSQSPEEELKSTEFKIFKVQCEAFVFCDNLSVMISICWCLWSWLVLDFFMKSKVIMAFCQWIYSAPCSYLLKIFLEMLISSSGRTYHLHTVPKVLLIVIPELDQLTDCPDLNLIVNLQVIFCRLQKCQTQHKNEATIKQLGHL